MALSSNKVTAFTFLHQNQPNQPNTVFPSTAAFKAAMDTPVQQLQSGLNGLIDALSSATGGGLSGSEQIGAAPIAGVTGATIFDQLSFIEAQVLAIVGASIPAGSITSAQIQNNAVTYSKLESGLQAASVGGSIYAYQTQGGW